MAGSYDHGQWLPMSPHQVITLTAGVLETYNPAWQPDYGDQTPPEGEGHYLGELGNHAGRWRLYVSGWHHRNETRWETVPLVVMNLMEDAASGLLANLSSRPDTSTAIVRGAQPVIENASEEGFDIEFVFAADVPASVRNSFYRAAYRWESVVVGNLPPESVSIYYGECAGSPGYIGEVDDLLVFVSMGYLGGRSGPQGRANVCVSGIRGDRVAPLPIAGWVWINRDATDDWNSVAPDFLDGITTHEIGHVLGFTPSILGASGHLRYYPTRHFAGPLARQAFTDQGGDAYAGDAVPMEMDSSHWHDHVLSGEIMAPSVGKSSVISRITVQALADLGYEVNVDAAEPYYKNVF